MQHLQPQQRLAPAQQGLLQLSDLFLTALQVEANHDTFKAHQT